MAGVKTLADGNVRFLVLPSKPANIDAVKVSEATAATAKNFSDNVLASDFDLGPTGADTIDERPLSARGNGQAYGNSNYGGGFTVFRFLDPTSGKADSTEDARFTAVKTKGTTLHILIIEDGKVSNTTPDAGTEYSYFEAVTDDPVRGERTGYIKYRINCAVQTASLNKALVT